MKRCRILFLLLFAMFTSETIANTAMQVLVKEIKNNALYRKTAHSQWQELQQGMEIKTGYEIKTLDKTRLILSFGKYGIVRIAPNSQLKINPPRPLQQEKFNLLLVVGKAWANITKRFNTHDSQIVLRTSNAAIRVKGTTYEASFQKNQTQVRVFSGQVNVNTQQPQEANLSLQPTEIEAPHEVSRQEWSIIVNAFESVTISGIQVPTKPKHFQVSQSDEWANWNLHQDQSF